MRPDLHDPARELLGKPDWFMQLEEYYEIINKKYLLWFLDDGIRIGDVDCSPQCSCNRAILAFR